MLLSSSVIVIFVSNFADRNNTAGKKERVAEDYANFIDSFTYSFKLCQKKKIRTQTLKR